MASATSWSSKLSTRRSYRPCFYIVSIARSSLPYRQVSGSSHAVGVGVRSVHTVVVYALTKLVLYKRVSPRYKGSPLFFCLQTDKLALPLRP
jgi:hypothetical protein